MAAFANPRTAGNAQPRGEEIASYGTYAEAQRAVDYLSDQQFDVKAVTIVGTDLKMVERITGRLNYPRAALSGAASGAWFGLFVGLLLALITEGTILNTMLFALLIGAGFGMMFGVIAYALTGGKRDFTSSSQVVASSFAVLCLPESAGEARRLLRGLSGSNVTAGGTASGGPGTGGPSTGSPGAGGPNGPATGSPGTDTPGTGSPDAGAPAGDPPAGGPGHDRTAPFRRPEQSPLPPEELPAWARDPGAYRPPQAPGSSQPEGPTQSERRPPGE